MQFGHLVVAQIPGGQPVLAQARDQRADFAAIAHLHADEDMRPPWIRVAVIELGDVAGAEQGAELPEAARLLGNRDGQNGLALLAQFGAFGNEPQAVEVHVGAARHGDQRPVFRLAALDPGLGASDRQSPGRLEDRTRILEHVLDRRADRVVVDQDHFVHQLAAQPKGFDAHLLDRNAVGEQPHLLELHSPAGGQRTRHRIRVDRLHANQSDLRPQPFDVGADARNQSPPADRDENGVDRPAVLTQDFHADGALACDHVGIVVGMHEGQFFAPGNLQGMRIGVVVGIAEQHHAGAARRDRRRLDLRRGGRHDDGGAAAKPLRRQRNALGMVAGRGGDHAALELRGAQMRHFVVGAPQFEGKHRLQVLALEQNGVTEPPRQRGRDVQRRFNRHVVDTRAEDLFEVIGFQ